MKKNTKEKEDIQDVQPSRRIPKMSQEQLLRSLLQDMSTCASLCMFIRQNVPVQDAIVAEMLRIQENHPQTFDEELFAKDQPKQP